MRMFIRFLLLSLAVFSISANASIQYATHKVSIIGQLGLSNGGDEIIDVEVNPVFGGTGNESVEAGSGYLFSLGLLLSMKNVPVDYQFNAGWFFDGYAGMDDHDEVFFSRDIMEFLVFYRAGKHRLGGGFALHNGPKVDYDVDGVGFKIRFDNEVAWVGQYRYQWTERFSTSLRYVAVDYESSQVTETLNGDHVGLLMGFSF